MLIIVSGAPGAGKTTLARLLARELRCAIAEKDAVKEALFSTLGTPPDRPASQRIGSAAIAVLLALAQRSVSDAGAELIIECNFRRGTAELDLAPLAESAPVRLIHCEAPREVMIARYSARGGRHPGHHDDAALADLRAGLERGEFEPLQIDAPVLRVDTREGYRPDLAAVVQFCLAARQGEIAPL